MRGCLSACSHRTESLCKGPVIKAWPCHHLAACFQTGPSHSLGATRAFHQQEADSFQNPLAQVAVRGWVQVGTAHPGRVPQHLPTTLCFFKGDTNQNRPKG